jgi:hypothetical protein
MSVCVDIKYKKVAARSTLHGALKLLEQQQKDEITNKKMAGK